GCLPFMPFIPSDRLEGELERWTPSVLPLADGEQRSACGEADRRGRCKQSARSGAKRAHRKARGRDHKNNDRSERGRRPEKAENTTDKQSARWQRHRNTHTTAGCKERDGASPRRHEAHEDSESKELRDLRVFAACLKSVKEVRTD